MEDGERDTASRRRCRPCVCVLRDLASRNQCRSSDARRRGLDCRTDRRVASVLPTIVSRHSSVTTDGIVKQFLFCYTIVFILF